VIWLSALAFIAGILVSLSRQINGRLSTASTPLVASLWNHIVGFALISALALMIGGLFGGLFEQGWPNPPAQAWLGGPIGVIFVAASSWLILRIGAVATALLVISGNMISGVILDLILGTGGNIWAALAGVTLILAGMALTHTEKRE